ncbi:Phosphoadenosine phosphosulfate reductase [Pandoraea pulmonicola]|uniref:Adenosine 5'-phosphosulfate reductase n=2 Tax=Pandoraea pulmonicola TaxID=93221 RepID=A0AAJ5CZQ9_PANPU|nr:Phosphoadenosine phosphosulfate reductase [Pandoraea pulmonicola]
MRNETRPDAAVQAAQAAVPLTAADAEHQDMALLDEMEAVLAERLARIAGSHRNVKFASSLAAEDMLITHVILRQQLPITVFTLNTGRLHAETLGMIDRIKSRYGYDVVQYAPQAEAVDAYVAEHGANAFYESVDLRKACCQIRKVEPLGRALADADAWLTGQRREQSVTRGELAFAEHDDARGIAKYNPLFDWTEAQVWAYLTARDVPVNPLHARGYPSIGCEPCTRAIRPGEDSRAGRWWWESRDSKECGLHASNLSRIPVSVQSS